VEVLTKKYGPLPGYAWLGIVTAGGFLWMRMRSGSSSADTSGSTDATAGGQGFDSGFGQGFNTGLAQGLGSGGVGATTPPPSTTGRKIYGYGKNGKPFYSLAAYEAALAAASKKGGRKVYGYGKNGKPFYNPAAAKAHHAAMHRKPVGFSGGGRGNYPGGNPGGPPHKKAATGAG
jgi:hypothetical protein